MSTIHEALWAKKSDKGPEYKWLSLKQHLIDTRNVGGLLWEHWLSPGQKKDLTLSLDYFDSDDAKRFVQFLCAIHDIGKATPAFQIKSTYFSSPDLDHALKEKLAHNGFFNVHNCLLASPSKSPHALAGQYLLSIYGVKEDIASIIGAHHGNPVDERIYVKRQAHYPDNYFQSENPNDPVYQHWSKVQRDIFEWALINNGYESHVELPAVPLTAQVILSGLVIMADWMASKEEYFPLLDLDTVVEANQYRRLENGWEKWHKTDLWEAENPIDPQLMYKERFNFTPRGAQIVCADTIQGIDDPGIIIFQAPMGSGKTEMALIGAEQLAYDTSRSGVFFGLPTQATSNSMFARVNDWLQKIAKEREKTLSIRLAHGKASLNENFISYRKASRTNIDGEPTPEGQVIIHEWFSGRKMTALDDFVVGTVDQFLLMSLQQKHLMLRHLGFSKKVVIIDEVHAYDAYMSVYLNSALRWLGAYGVPAILLSATLPLKTRDALIENYLLGKGLSSKEIGKQLEEFREINYPSLLYSDGKIIKHQTDFPQEKQKAVQVEIINSEEIGEFLDTLIEKGGVIGLMVNTVRKAQVLAETYTKKYGSDTVFLLHANFIATDRIAKDNALLKMIGKGAKRPKHKIVIGTQVIEQSLDIDFDVLITELAPMDLLIQRIGRLFRHESTIRPPAYTEPKTYIVGTDANFDFDEGSAAVYLPYFLARTQYFLKDRIMLPEDIAPLVEMVYGEEPIELENHLKEKYSRMEIEKDNVLLEKAKRAKVFRLKRPKQSDTLIGWLKQATQDLSEEKAYAQVRDTVETIEVIALKKIGSGYGLFAEEEDLSQLIEESSIAKRIATQTLTLPRRLSVHYNIDRTIAYLEEFNRKYLGNWQRSPWLKGSLGIIFDENNTFELNGEVLKYDQKYGLKSGKE